MNKLCDEERMVLAVLWDFTKAFDCVNCYMMCGVLYSNNLDKESAKQSFSGGGNC